MGANNKRKTTEEYKKEVFNLVGNLITVESEYINCKTHVKMLCHECNNYFEMSPDHFLRGYRCPKCSYKKLGRSRRHNQETVKKTLLERGYEILSEYKTSNERITVKRLECGHEFSAIYREMITGRVVCPKCRTSKGEFKIRKWLEDNNFKFKEQFRFDNCRDIRPLPFDFSVDVDSENILIEFNGRQHYDPNFRDVKEKDSLENIQRRDNIKKDFCIKNNKKLLVIRYDSYDEIENILNKYFLNSTTIRKEYTQVSGNGETLKWE